MQKKIILLKVRIKKNLKRKFLCETYYKCFNENMIIYD